MEDVALEVLLADVVAHPVPEHVACVPAPTTEVVATSTSGSIVRRIVAVVRSLRARR